ncbi:MAG: HAD family hydrolase [Deltaproteobacteria bacterium]|nr:HAD family hydrolase [Deltaproteobacteria bacterium]
MKCEAVIFDMDGTLLDSLDDIADSMNFVLESIGLPVHNVADYRKFVGNGIRELVRRVLPEEIRDEKIIENCVERMREVYGNHWADKTKTYDGIPELLNGLTMNNTRMAILSNKPDDFTRKMARKLLGLWTFDVVAGQRPNIPEKPDPKAALEIAGQLGVNPDKCFFLGDTNVDMITASAAGMFPVGVLWGFRNREELLASGAMLLLNQPPDLLEHIDRI